MEQVGDGFGFWSSRRRATERPELAVDEVKCPRCSRSPSIRIHEEAGFRFYSCEGCTTGFFAAPRELGAALVEVLSLRGHAAHTVMIPEIKMAIENWRRDL